MPKHKIQQSPSLAPSIEPQHRVLILRTCNAQMRSYGGFTWPRSGRVEAPNWKPTKECGNGLHGFLNGEGAGSLASFDPDSVWIAAWVDPALVIDLDGKVKFPWAEVSIAGTREEATQFLRDNGCSGAIVGGTATAGYGGILNIRYWDGKRYRIAIFYVGEDGIQANTNYRCDETGKVVAA